MTVDPGCLERWQTDRERERAIAAAYEAALGEFARRNDARPIRWSGYYLSRLLRLTGERPERVAEMWAILGALGMAPWRGGVDRRWPSRAGVFDHGGMWGRAGKPWAVVGHPYQVGDDERGLLSLLGRRFPTLLVNVDDQPSYYGFGTHHVRIEVPEPRRSFRKPPATWNTRAAARAARKAFAEEVGLCGCRVEYLR